jgi:hypothetical protein
MEDVQIVEDFLSIKDLNHVLEKSKNFIWKYGHTSTSSGIKFWHCDLESDTFFKTYILNKIENCFNRRFVVNRVYANGQTYGMDGSYHVDNNDDDAYTFLIYVSDITHKNVNTIDGHTLFKKDDRIICIEPILNRGVLFKSNILHKGMGPSRSANMLRISIAFKLREIK